MVTEVAKKYQDIQFGTLLVLIRIVGQAPKLFTACINARLSQYLECAGVLGDEQAGFRRNHSTLDHIFTLHSLIDLYLHQRRIIYCAFVDYKKAYDFVDRSSLWSNLISSGINGKFLLLLIICMKMRNLASNLGINFLTSLLAILGYMYVKERIYRHFFLQFSPNDFEYFVSWHYKGFDMCSSLIREHVSDEDVEVFLRLYVLLYADDPIILAESAEELQAILTAVHNYCELWKLSVNTSKTKIVNFSRGRVRKYPVFMFGNNPLEVVDD